MPKQLINMSFGGGGIKSEKVKKELKKREMLSSQDSTVTMLTD